MALGRALVRNPRVFLLDEPLSNLDAGLRTAMRMEIARLHRTLQATMVYVTHDQIEAMTLGQRIVVMDQGRVQQVDTPMRIYDQPANLFVAGFLGSPGMNLVRGRLDRQGPSLRLPGEGMLAMPAVDLERGPLAGHLGGELVVGLRPEALGLERDMPGQPCLEARLEVIERVGNEAYLHLHMGEQALVARVPPHDLPEPGRPVRLAYAPARMHFFDPASGQRLATET